MKAVNQKQNPIIEEWTSPTVSPHPLRAVPLCPATLKPKPWLNSEGSSLSTDELTVISKGWSSELWESYLSTIEGSQRECQASAVEIEELALETSFFEWANQSPNEDLYPLVNSLLETLTDRQRDVIEKIFFEGMSERQIAKILMVSRQGVCDLKRRALKKLIKTAQKSLANFTYSIGAKNAGSKQDRSGSE